MTKEDYEFMLKIQKCANRGTSKAREEAKKAGLPIPYSRNGKLYYELPDGTIVDKIDESRISPLQDSDISKLDF